jgi:hypothetical protein
VIVILFMFTVASRLVAQPEQVSQESARDRRGRAAERL